MFVGVDLLAITLVAEQKQGVFGPARPGAGLTVIINVKVNDSETSLEIRKARPLNVKVTWALGKVDPECAPFYNHETQFKLLYP